jgi:hypothetical protein
MGVSVSFIANSYLGKEKSTLFYTLDAGFCQGVRPPVGKDGFMRQNLVIALLSVCCALLSVNVYIALRTPQLPVAFGQAGGGDDVLIAGANTQNEAFCFVYNKRSNKLVSYMNRTSSGLELMGIRDLGSDFHPKIREYPPSKKKTAVSNMSKFIRKLEKSSKKRK